MHISPLQLIEQSKIHIQLGALLQIEALLALSIEPHDLITQIKNIQNEKNKRLHIYTQTEIERLIQTTKTPDEPQTVDLGALVHDPMQQINNAYHEAMGLLDNEQQTQIRQNGHIQTETINELGITPSIQHAAAVFTTHLRREAPAAISGL